jgi:hypothetical protein
LHETELPVVIAWLVDYVITDGHDSVDDGEGVTVSFDV